MHLHRNDWEVIVGWLLCLSAWAGFHVVQINEWVHVATGIGALIASVYTALYFRAKKKHIERRP